MAESSSIGVEIGVEILTRTVPKGIAWVRHRLAGRKVLVIGQPRAGKTSFVRYLRYGTLADPNVETEVTREVQKTASFTFGMGRDNALRLEINRVYDAVGQIHPGAHADNVFEYRPHAIVVLLDLSSHWSGDTYYYAGYYLEELCLHLSQKLMHDNTMRRKIRTIVFVLNKQDKSDKTAITEWRKNSSATVQKLLIPTFGPQARTLPIMPCTLLAGIDEGKSASAIITNLGLSLA